MAFDGEAFVRRFGEVWNAHDLDGIVNMFTDDVVFEASFGEQPWGTRAVGKAAARQLIENLSGCPTYAGMRSGTSSVPSTPRSSR